MIRIDAIWMSTEPLDMRAGFDKALARVVQVFGAAHPHHAYLFANARSNRMKVLVHVAMPPSPQAVERMLETMRWVQWLEVEQRQLVWMRSSRYRWEQIGRRFACAARTAQRRYDAAIHLVTLHLNKGH